MMSRHGPRVVKVAAVLLLAGWVSIPRSAPAAGEDVRRSIQDSIVEIESRLREDLPPQEEAVLLWDLAERARLLGDLVRTRYALSQLRESLAWPTFSRKQDALVQAALLEESQARFGKAAELYEQILQEVLPRPSPLTLNSGYAGYALRWADCLEKSGDSRQAAEIFWDLARNLPDKQQKTALVRLMRNYRYGWPSADEIKQLAERVRATEDLGMLWQLAQMYTAKGMLQEASDLFDELWSRQPSFAVYYLDDLLAAFRWTGRLEALLEKAESRSSDRAVARFLASAYQRLGRPREALDVITRCQAAIANAMVARLAVLPATARASVSTDPLDLTPELNELKYQALQAVGNVTGAAKLARAMCQRRPRDSEWYEAASRLPGADVVSLWRSYVQAQGRPGPAYQQAAQALAELGCATESIAFLAEGAAAAPGLLVVLAYADALISNGSMEEAWRQYGRLVASKWTTDQFLTRHLTELLEGIPGRDAVRSLLEPRLAQPPGVSWEDQILRTLLVEAGETDRLLDWIVSDSSGLAAVRLAQWALLEGYSDLALAAYERVPEESLYGGMARIEMARILRDTGSEDIRTFRRIGDLLDSAVEKLSLAPGNPSPARWKELEVLDLWARVNLSAGKGLKVLERLYGLFGQERELIVERYERSEADEILLLRGLALSQAGSLSDAVEEFRAVSGPRLAAQSAFHEARTLFWQEEFAEAESKFEQVVTQPGGWRLANDGLRYLTFLKTLGLDSIRLLSKATFLAWQGRWDDAVPAFRDLSVREYGQDIGEWARYMIGKVLWDAGETESALAEWERLSRDGSYGWLRNRLTWELVSKYPVSASKEVDRGEWLRDILSSGRETLFGDLARLRLRRDGPGPGFSMERPEGDV